MASLLPALLLGCTITSTPSPPTATSLAISCQPFGYTPAPIPFSFAPGPVTSSTAEQTAAALFRDCELATSTITDLSSSSTEATGSPGGPNAGQPVWRVEIAATVTTASPGDGYRSYFVIEVNRATGLPTVIAYG